MKNRCESRGATAKRTVWIALAVLVAAGVGVGAFELASHARADSHKAEAASAPGSADTSTAWIYDPNRPLGWNQMVASASAPDPRSDLSLVYAPVVGQVILFGGEGVGEAPEGRFLGDTWTYDVVGRDWAKLPASSSGTSPEPRGAHSAVFVPLTGEVVLFGGRAAHGVLGDTWEYDPLRNAWSTVTGASDPWPSSVAPASREQHTMVFATLAGVVVLFGGLSQDSLLGDTWSYDPIRHAWTELQPSGATPDPRRGHSMVYDATSGKVVMWGGVGADGTVLSDTWAYDTVANSWTELRPPSPAPGRSAAAAACASTTGSVTMFGGLDAQLRTSAESWSYDFDSSWVKTMAGEPAPSTRAGSALAYCELSDTHVLFGGRDDAGHPLNDTWVHWAPAVWW